MHKNIVSDGRNKKKKLRLMIYVVLLPGPPCQCSTLTHGILVKQLAVIDPGMYYIHNNIVSDGRNKDKIERLKIYVIVLLRPPG